MIDRKDEGKDYSHQARCVFSCGPMSTYSLWARSLKHTLRPEFNLNNGDPTKMIRVRVALL
jgi:hypothetical protein